ncbi:calcium-binding protein KIC-like [Selaginella moellendorffii]|uniref:calcium-binding protein KIC-like n=1 Tax=Selaginella moellendorffii TaxID=88036 RepID=UPI000D1C5168|nr:calcium-binding protein KIC-like [Selaginella moellendorffii]|eukprot:XP_024516400.1 calcium-binding protein KIC-like [Selaginella moellendorffii]
MGLEAAAAVDPAGAGFMDYFPVMARRLGEQDFMEELCKGFELLADPATGTITLGSLKRNAALLGLEELGEEELRAMVVQGDYDGDGALNQHEFCILMVRMSPSLLCEAEEWLEDAIGDELLEEFGYWAMDEDDCGAGSL